MVNFSNFRQFGFNFQLSIQSQKMPYYKNNFNNVLRDMRKKSDFSSGLFKGKDMRIDSHIYMGFDNC